MSTPADAIIGNAAAGKTWQLENIAYVFTTLTLADNLIFAIQKSVADMDNVDINKGMLGEFKIFGEGFRSVTQALGANITSSSVQLPFNYSSLASVFFYFRPDIIAGDFRLSRQTARTSKTITSFSLDVAGRQYPSQEVTGFSSMYSEVVKTMHALAKIKL